MQIRYDGKYCWSRYHRGHVSWCFLKVVQSEAEAREESRAVVIFSRALDNPGTSIAVGMEVLATQVTDLFRLDPLRTIYVEFSPPERPVYDVATIELCEAEQQLYRAVLACFGPGDGRYELVSFEKWDEEPDITKPRYKARGACWMPITPVEVARFVQALERAA